MPVPEADAPVSATIFDAQRIDALDPPQAVDLLRLAPGVAVAVTGPRGTQAQLRIRGAEANHSLLFVDGIRMNDPAAGNEPRFELLAADLVTRLELVRGPQSALWGSEAIGGVIASETADPLRRQGLRAQAEYGSLDSARLSARGAWRSGDLGLAAGAAWQRSDGIDSFGAGGERDGYALGTATVKAAVAPAPGAALGLVGHWIEGRSDYDGFDPLTFRRADTLDSTRNRLGAVRGWGRLARGPWTFEADAGFLASRNRNLLDGAPLNRTAGERLSLGGQVSHRSGGHRLTAALRHEAEGFAARDTAFGGATRQDRERSLTALAGEWRAEWSPRVATDLAVRRDSFSAFADATSWRGAVLLRPATAWTLHAAWGEGIAQPSFYDLFGFFPGSFVGNPGLKPERSRGWEAGLRWRSGRLALGATWFDQRLQDEIVDTFDPATFLSGTANAAGTSRRRGLEVEAEYRFGAAARIAANYSFLDAGERQVAGTALVRELRRPRHSLNLIADGRAGRLGWGASLAWVGARRDLDFDLFPAAAVRLDDYLLASGRIAWRIGGPWEAFARVENGFDTSYRDVVGYATPGRTVHAGLRLALGL